MLSKEKEMRMERFRDYKYGFFVHYVWGGTAYLATPNPDGSTPNGLQELADQFPVEQFAQQMERIGAQYVIFTAFHANMNAMYPSQVLDRFLPGHSAKRDLIREVIDALKSKGIQVMLYTHPRDGHDLTKEEGEPLGWALSYNPATGAPTPEPDFSLYQSAKWNDFINALYEELTDRYGADLLGLYMDEGDAEGKSWKVVDYPRLERTIHKKYPHLVLVQNYYGDLYSCDLGSKEFCHWREFKTTNGEDWPCYASSVGAVMASEFFPTGSNQQEVCVYSPEDLFRYTVLEASACSDGGGIQWAAGPYPDGSWEKDVMEQMEQVYRYLKPIEASVKNTRPSTAYPTVPGTSIRQLEWGVATQSADGETTYLHILKKPQGLELKLPLPQDGRMFSSAGLLSNGKAVTLKKEEDCILLTLSPDCEWDILDTVICLQ